MKKVKDFEEGMKVMVVGEYLEGGTTYRQLAYKYGVPRATINRWVTAGIVEKKPDVEKRYQMRSDGPHESGEMKRLREELEKERLKNKLLSAVIEIAEEQLGVDILKKHGAKR